ncbi:hypothetical protein COLO4_35914 [Corchorus olitorius]|uniref:Uncharacterized protein n=1 Tax=Corchorus olitorius TaxID=93759 RepID=A0A1R3GC00_9ROSI|nr:hypothetical protein COLO4_35914 [Corchorus olitorius]
MDINNIVHNFGVFVLGSWLVEIMSIILVDRPRSNSDYVDEVVASAFYAVFLVVVAHVALFYVDIAMISRWVCGTVGMVKKKKR